MFQHAFLHFLGFSPQAIQSSIPALTQNSLNPSLTVASDPVQSQAAQSLPAIAENGCVSRFWLSSEQIDHLLWRLKLQSFQSLRRIRIGFSHLPDGSIWAQQLRQLNLFQIIADIPPGISGTMFNYPFQEQG